MDEDELTGPTSNPNSLIPESQSPAQPEPPAIVQPGKDEISARVRTHRTRNRVREDQPALPGMEDAASPTSIAARVAERYARLPSYRETLAAQAAEKSAPRSPAAASTPEPTPPQLTLNPPAAEPEPASAPDPEPFQPELIRYSVSTDSLPTLRSTPPEARIDSPAPSQGPEFAVIDPLETAVVEPTLPLPARLITSPRELVAPRKARPRLAEGPLRDDPSAQHSAPEIPSVAEEEPPVANSPAETTGLRVAPAAPASAYPDPSASTPPEWRSIHLDSEAPIPEPQPSSALIDETPLRVASLKDRARSGLMDCALVLSAFLLFWAVFAICSTNLPHGRIALIGASAILFAMWLLYQLLFFTLTDATPGMRYAQIALCTFDDENPSRAQLRGRIAALLLSALPLGLGFLWAVFDEDTLGWHDRITQTYQRSYREQ